MSDGDERCSGCDRTIGWIDARWACPAGCLYCPECGREAAGSCASCGEPLAKQSARARVLPG